MRCKFKLLSRFARSLRFHDGPRSVANRVEVFSYIKHAEHQGQAMAIGIQLPLLELHHD